MTDPELRSRQAQSVLDTEVFAEVCREVEDDAIAKVRQSTSQEELLAARAQLLAVADLRKRLQGIVDSYSFTQARSARKPLA